MTHAFLDALLTKLIQIADLRRCTIIWAKNWAEILCSQGEITQTLKKLIADLLHDLPSGEIIDVCIGLHWTAVVADVGGVLSCGLASTLRSDLHNHGEPTIPTAGNLIGMPATELAANLKSEHPTRSSLGLAALNALLPRSPELWADQHAEETILELGIGKRVALIGHFPFVPRLREQIAHLDVLEFAPLDDDLPASVAPKIIPQADVVAITGMTLHNGTLEALLVLCSPDAKVLLLGPSTPLSQVMFDYGIDLLAGAVVEKINPVLETVRQGGNFRQVRRAGVRLVTYSSD